MRKVGVAAAVVVAGLIAAAPASGTGFEGELQSVLDGVDAGEVTVAGASGYADGPMLPRAFNGATGKVGHGLPQDLHPDDPFRNASSTKIYTAAMVLRLQEEGALSIDDRIEKWLAADIVSRVKYADRITLRHLLNHTSGIFGHDEDPLFLPLVAAQPTKRWTAEEQIDIALRHEPYFEPGEGWHYSDTGFVMLGLVIQKATGKDLGAAARELLGFDRLELGSTWWELFEPAPEGARPRVHQYYKALDATYHNPSFDSWGGGGLVTTNRDQAVWIRALFSGQIFEQPETLELMTTTVPIPDRGFDYAHHYGLGIGQWTRGGVECWGQPGFWSIVVFYCPELDVALSGATNQASNENDEHTEQLIANGFVRVLKQAATRQAKLTLSVKPSRTRTGRKTRFRFRTAPGATLQFAGRRATADRHGRTTITKRFRTRGTKRGRACKRGLGCATANVRVRNSPTARARTRALR